MEKARVFLLWKKHGFFWVFVLKKDGFLCVKSTGFFTMEKARVFLGFCAKKGRVFVVKKDGFFWVFVMKKARVFLLWKKHGFFWVFVLKKDGFFEKTRVFLGFCDEKSTGFLKKHGFFSYSCSDPQRRRKSTILCGITSLCCCHYHAKTEFNLKKDRKNTAIFVSSCV